MFSLFFPKSNAPPSAIHVFGVERINIAVPPVCVYARGTVIFSPQETHETPVFRYTVFVFSSNL